MNPNQDSSTTTSSSICCCSFIPQKLIKTSSLDLKTTKGIRWRMQMLIDSVQNIQSIAFLSFEFKRYFSHHFNCRFLNPGKMSWDKIVPSVLDQEPAELLEIKFPYVEVQLGQELKPADLLAPPSFASWPNMDLNAQYSMVLVDCDPEDAVNFQQKQLNLGMGVNMSVDYITKGFAAVASPAPYHPPRPKEGSGLHRYLIVVFKQPDTLYSVPYTFDEFSRHNFDVREFARRYNLGKPVAGTYFVAQADHSTIEYWAHNYSKSFSKSGGVSFKCAIL